MVLRKKMALFPSFVETISCFNDWIVKNCKKIFHYSASIVFIQFIFLLFCQALFWQMNLVNIKHIRHWIVSALFFILIMGCEREYLYRGDESGVMFSVDTVRFDTIFSDLSSVTKNFKIYNPSVHLHRLRRQCKCL